MVPQEICQSKELVASRWNAKANRASGTREDARELNHYLDVLQSKTYEARKKLIDSGRIVTAVAIMDIMSGAEQRKRELMSLFKAHNDDMKAMIGKGVAKGTWINFNTTYRANMKKIIIGCIDNGWLKSDPFAKSMRLGRKYKRYSL